LEESLTHIFLVIEVAFKLIFICSLEMMVGMGVCRNISRGGNVDVSLILFQIAKHVMQMALHKTLYPL